MYLPAISELEPIARAAGEAIMSIYSQPFAVEYKQDESPLTAADKGPRGDRSGAGASHSRYPGVVGRVLPEVMAARLGWSRYWLVDPLDGTKEFVSRNGEFTVNIALIERGPRAGGWSMPRYWTSSGMGARGLAPGVWLMASTRPSRPALMRKASVAGGGQPQSPLPGHPGLPGALW
jgi:3'(2'), 5'-bisphosphate nucleotidase